MTIPIDARIIGCELGDKPPWREPGWDEDESGRGWSGQLEPNHAPAGPAGDSPVAAMAAGSEDIPY